MEWVLKVLMEWVLKVLMEWPGQLGHSRHHLSYPILFYPILVEGEFYPKFLRSLEF
jgi:hypothetical protein